MFHIERQLAYLSKINDSLFLSGRDSLEDEQLILDNGIGFVVSIVKTPPKLKNESLKHLVIPIDDSIDTTIGDYFDAVFTHIKAALAQNSKILIHCEKGISRSASFVIAWLMFEAHNRQEIVDYDKTFRTVKEIRSMICPNPSFAKQLKEYAGQLNTSSVPLPANDSAFTEMKLPEKSLFPLVEKAKRSLSFFEATSAPCWEVKLKDVFCISDMELAFWRLQSCSMKEVYSVYLAIGNTDIRNKSLPVLVGFMGNKAIYDNYVSYQNLPYNPELGILVGAIYGSGIDLVKRLFPILTMDKKHKVLCIAVAANKLSLIQYLFDTATDLDWNKRDDTGGNLLFLAAFYGRNEIFQFLYQQINVDARVINKAGASLLESLCYSDNQSLVKYIQENLNFLDPNAPNNSGLAPVRLAKMKKNTVTLNVFETWEPIVVSPVGSTMTSECGFNSL